MSIICYMHTTMLALVYTYKYTYTVFNTVYVYAQCVHIYTSNQ